MVSGTVSAPSLVGGSTNPFEKYANVKLDHFPKDRREHKQYLIPPPRSFKQNSLTFLPEILEVSSTKPPTPQPRQPANRASSARHRSFGSTLAAIHRAPHHTPLVMEHQVHTSSVPSSRPLFFPPKLIGETVLWKQTLMSSLFERNLLK